MSIRTSALLLVSCAVCTLSLPAIWKRQVDTVDVLCAGMIAENGSLSYTVEVDTDCTKFAQCLPDGGYLVSDCPPLTFFDPVIRGCQVSNIVTCAGNPCAGQPDGVAVADTRGCATFFGCSRGVAEPLTCPEGQAFQGSSCVPHPSCGLQQEQTTTFPLSPAELCASKGVKPYPGDNTMFIASHAGGGEVEMNCPPGTYLDAECSCVF